MKIVKFNVSRQKLQARKICPIFEKGGNTPKISSDLNENHTLRFNIPEIHTIEVSSSYIHKCEILYFLPDDQKSLIRTFSARFKSPKILEGS